MPAHRPSGSAAPQRLRVAFLSPPDFTPVASVWVDAWKKPAGLEVALLVEYPDLHPVSGWHLDHDGTHYVVEGETNGRLQCVAIPGGNP